ncbi:MAG: M28 family peptidase [Candidatus Electrothrix sp. GW3-4]|uniref:M28 family peptidase n=1 Tax=Candidatus Electrothrix sp. GW3-4 TaxID=3126740 RepID=UPI0030D5D7E9
MKEFFSKRTRMLAALAFCFLLLCISAIVTIRQPTSKENPFPSDLRADPDRLRWHVEYLAEELAPRNHNHPKKLAATVRYITTGLSVPGTQVSLQSYRAENAASGQQEQVNIIARFGSREGPVVIIGAHYDAFGDFPGADDNASGIAGLLELARLLSRREITGNIELVAYGTEEDPFFGTEQMGSAVHAQRLAEQGRTVKAMLCLEMIGYFVEQQEYNSWVLRLIYPQNGLYAAVVGRWQDRHLAKTVKRCFDGASDLPTVSYSGPVLFGADLSDHRNYWQHGYPAVMITDTAFLRNHNYHAAGDTPDTLDYQRMAKVVDGVLSTALTLSLSTSSEKTGAISP